MFGLYEVTPPFDASLKLHVDLAVLPTREIQSNKSRLPAWNRVGSALMFMYFLAMCHEIRGFRKIGICCAEVSNH